MLPLRFKDLASISGVQSAYGPSDEEAFHAQISDRVDSLIRKYPELADTRVSRSNRDSYDYINDVINVKSRDPDILAHEVEHAASLGESSSLYKKLLEVSQSAVRINNTFALPAVLALGSAVDDEKKKRLLYKTLLGISAVAAAPNLWEEAKASTNVVLDSPDSMSSAIKLFPAFAAHAAHDLAGAGVYLGALQISKQNKARKK